MDLRSISDETLVRQTENLVKQEREVLADLLRHLQENERRRLFSSLGYKSLFDYTVNRLGYPEDQAWRRIKAMRLMKEIPELESKIENGEITLTHISIARNLFRQEEIHDRKFTAEEKVQVFERIANKTSRQAQQEVVKMSTASEIIFDRVRPIGEETVEIRFPAPAELEEKLQRLKGLIAHSDPNITLSKLIDKLCELGFREWDPTKQRLAKKISAARAAGIVSQTRKISIEDLKLASDRFGTGEANEARNAKPARVPDETTIGYPSEPRPPTNFCDTARPAAPRVTLRQQGRRISQQTKREVWTRERGRCSKCGSTYALQIDHCEPHAHGGSNNTENLRLLCRTCNQRSAVESFGMEKMGEYLT